MKHQIFSFADSNIAGFGWRWDFYIQRHAKAWRLSAHQAVTEDLPTAMQPRSGLSDGGEVYAALQMMLGEAGYDLRAGDLPGIAATLERLDPQLASDFLRGEEITEERAMAAAQCREEHRERRLKPFRAQIDAYVAGFPESSAKHGFPGKRLRVRIFIEDFVARNGRLPKGIHDIALDGRAHEMHDFSDLS